MTIFLKMDLGLCSSATAQKMQQDNVSYAKKLADTTENALSQISKFWKPCGLLQVPW